MCGIAGFVNGGDQKILERMARLLAHRGPDDEGFYIERSDNYIVGLSSRRLAIRDLTKAGHMPMTSGDGRFVIVYNGEIYNHQKLRRHLEERKYAFHSTTDTEVLLYLFQEHGHDCLKYLNGMFAFAIWDRQTRELFIARDHFGIKPLYFCHQGDRLIFASEMKAILEWPDVPRTISHAALHQYLTFLWVPEPLTIFEGISKLPAAHYATFKDGTLKIRRYWDLLLPQADHAFADSESHLATELRQRWENTVKSQLVSDVPVGCFLSAGLDSSGILSAMCSSGLDSPKSFTICFPPRATVGESSIDDTAVAARTASKLGSRHRKIMVEPDVVNLLPKLIWHMDEPVADPALIMAYLVNREAAKEVKVLLSGVGGDELFAGYRKYRAHYLAIRYKKIPATIRKHLIEPGVRALPSFRGTRFKGYVRLAKKMARSGSLPEVERFLTDSVYFTEAHKQRLYTPEYREATSGIDPFTTHRQHLARVKHADFLNQMMYLDLQTFTPSLNLAYNDKMSMASSVEVRVPYLDRELAEWAFRSIPPSLKLQNGTQKYILRKALGDSLPSEVLQQTKAGFGAPIDNWLAHDLDSMLSDLLNESQVHNRGIFGPGAVQELLKEHRAGREDRSLLIWALLTLEIWMRQFLH